MKRALPLLSLVPLLSLALAARAEAQQAPSWTRGATCYEIFVRSFYDSNGDGIGDLKGIIQKLPYVQSLGASCIWLTPIMPSPSYHGYDITDYYSVNPQFGTNADFTQLVAAAHHRGIRILVDLVLNHTSNQHPDFIAAEHDTTSPFRAWYRFSPTKLGPGPWGDTNAWRHSPVRNEYYYGPFSVDMPDLDYHTPAVREEANRIAAFWIQHMGVDGFRLDAIPYIVEEGSCEMGCAGTHQLLAEWSQYVHSLKRDAWTVGEAWGNLDAIMPYYPDQLLSYFGFPLADSLVRAVRRGSAGNMLADYLRLQDTMPPWRYSPFLSNHDGTRVMTLLGGDMAKMREAATLLLTLPGLPFVYYGEEIGMTGDKPDPRLRTPMQWAPAQGTGFTTGRPWEGAAADSMTATVQAQDHDSGSLLNLYRRLIHLRKTNSALAMGKLTPLHTDGAMVAYLREGGTRPVLVMANLGDAAIDHPFTCCASSLPRGLRRARNLLTGRSVALDAPLAPHEALVLEVSR